MIRGRLVKIGNCISLQSIHIPNGVIIIHRHTFDGCTSLRSINIPVGVTSIGHNAFRGCTSLLQRSQKKFNYIPTHVTTVGDCEGLSPFMSAAALPICGLDAVYTLAMRNLNVIVSKKK